MWKTKNKISGVSDSTLVDLRATLFEKEQGGGKRGREIDERKRPTKKLRLTPKEKKESIINLGPANKGVSERAKRDALAMERGGGPTLEESEAKLKLKADIYGRVERGVVGESDELFLVDFDSKKWDNRSNVSQLMALPVEQRVRIANATLPSNWKTVEAYRDEAEYEQAREDRRQLIEQLSEETSLGRKRHLEAKRMRRTQAEKRRKQIALLHPPKDGDEEITEEKTTTTSKSSSLAHSDLSLEENQEKKKQVQDFLNKMRESLRKESGSSGPVNAADHGEEKWRYG